MTIKIQLALDVIKLNFIQDLKQKSHLCVVLRLTGGAELCVALVLELLHAHLFL